jgi:hypothetical protein
MRSLLPAPARIQQYVQASLRPRTRERETEIRKLVAEGAAQCPRCGTVLDLVGYRRTETHYMVEEVLRCVACSGELLLMRHEMA